jgi:hypothetical protein
MPLHDGALPENIPATYRKCKTSLAEGRLVVLSEARALLFLGRLRFSTLLRNEVRLLHAFLQMPLIELMYVLVVGPGLLIRRDRLLLENPVALQCDSLVGNTLPQYRKRARKSAC